MKIRQTYFTYPLLALGCTALVACGGDSSSDRKSDRKSEPVAMKGTAAIGAPIGNATIGIQCGGVSLSATTNAQGEYKVTESKMENAEATFPCALKVESDMGTLVSYTMGTGVTNVTPLTTLALAGASGLVPAGWYSQVDADYDFDDLDAKVGAAIDGLKGKVNGDEPDFDFFSAAFKADGKSAYDVWLDAFGEALAKEQYEFENFVSVYADGTNSFDSITITLPEDAIPGGDYDLHITVKVSGVSGNEIIVENMPKPENKSQFCGGDYGDYMSADGSLTIISCSFSDNKGAIKAKVTSQGYTVNYEATYEWK